MYQIDFINHGNNTIEFVYDYDALFIAMNIGENMGVDYSFFNEYYIDRSELNHRDNLYSIKLLIDPRYRAFLRDLNSAIIDTRLSIVNAVDSYDGSDIQQLIVNGDVLGTTNHISDEIIDMMLSSHISDYSTHLFDQFRDENGIDSDGDNIDIYELKMLIDRFIDIVALMNGEE